MSDVVYRKVVKIGGSVGLTIPKKFKLERGTVLKVWMEDSDTLIATVVK